MEHDERPDHRRESWETAHEAEPPERHKEEEGGVDEEAFTRGEEHTGDANPHRCRKGFPMRVARGQGVTEANVIVKEKENGDRCQADSKPKEGNHCLGKPPHHGKSLLLLAWSRKRG